MALARYTLSGKYYWNIEEVLANDTLLDTDVIVPVSFGRYISHFRFEKKQKILSDDYDIKLYMKLECPKNPILTIYDNTIVTLRIGMNTDGSLDKFKQKQDNSGQKCSVKIFNDFTLVYDRTITENDRKKNDCFVMSWSLGTMKGAQHQQVQFEMNNLEKRERLFRFVLEFGDIKMFYKVDRYDQLQPLKKRKMNTNQSLSVNIDNEQNYLLMSAFILKNESAYFKTYLSQNNFDDGGNRVYFDGSKTELLHLIEFIVVGRINKDIRALEMIEKAGLVGVRRFQMALIRTILDAMEDKKYVGTINTLIRNETIESVFEELIGYGAIHLNRLKKRGDWSSINKVAANAIKLQHKYLKNRK